MSLEELWRSVKAAKGFEYPKAADLEPMLDEYYRIMGWDAQGIPTQKRLKDLEITKLLGSDSEDDN
jgi:aldehyde:ferredoxin oxidoreductase